MRLPAGFLGPRPIYFLLLLLGGCLGLCAQVPQLGSPDAKTPVAAGFFQLEWEVAQQQTSLPVFELQEANNPAFAQAQTIYKGSDTARTITGKPNGIYHYRIRVLAGPGPAAWSKPLALEVRHHPLPKAFAYFAVGAFVFVASLVAIYRGANSE